MKGVGIYQIVHTLAGRIMHLDKHLKIIFDSYYELFNSGITLKKSEIESHIKQLLKSERVSQSASVMVRITATAKGEIELSIEERSIYSGYTLRCISPKAALVEYDIPYIALSTTAREEMTALANISAERKSAHIALRSHDGVVDIANCAQLFAVKGLEIYTSPQSFSIEHSIAMSCAKELTIKFVAREIMVDELATLDELFYADHNGITAIAELNRHRYMSIVAEEIAALMLRKM